MKNKKFIFTFRPHRHWTTLFLFVHYLNITIEAHTEKSAFKRFRDLTDEEIIRAVRM